MPDSNFLKHEGPRDEVVFPQEMSNWHCGGLGEEPHVDFFFTCFLGSGMVMMVVA